MKNRKDATEERVMQSLLKTSAPSLQYPKVILQA